MSKKFQKTSLYILKILGLSLLISTFLLNLYYYWYTQKPAGEALKYNLVIPKSSKTLEKSISKPETLEFTTTFFGDVFWGRRMHTWAQASDLKYNYPFSALDTFEKQDYEYWIANLECPVTKETATEYQLETLLKFSCDPNYLDPAKKYFDTFSIGNNHTDNMEEVDGFEQTKKFLKDSGIQYFGHYDNQISDLCNISKYQARPNFTSPEITADYTKFLELKASKDLSLEDYHWLFWQQDFEQYDLQVPLAMCGYHHVFRLPTEPELQEIAKFSKYFPLITMPHQGVEYITQPDNFQKNIFRNMIDLGASAVMGGHTHSILPVEEYKEGLIAYSLGNFIFDQQFNAQVTTGLGVKLQWQIQTNEQTLKILQAYQECDSLECFEKAKTEELSKFQTTYTVDYVVSDSANQLTKKASPQISDRILNNLTLQS